MAFNAATDDQATGNRPLALTELERPANGNGHPANGNGHRWNGIERRKNHNGLPPRGIERRRGGNGHRLRGGLPGGVTVSVVIPALNEAENLPYVLPRIPNWVDEVLLVDGLSEDGTVELAAALLPKLRVVEHLEPGKGAALQAGFRAARGDVIVALDADGSTDPAEIPAFVGALLAGADYAKGSRFLQGGGTADMGPLRRAGNWALRALVRIGFGGRYSDLCYGYNAFWRDRVLPAFEGEAHGFEIETLMNVRVLAAGMKVVEVPSHEAARIYGESHLRTWRDGFRVLRTIVREWLGARGRRRRTRVESASRLGSTAGTRRQELPYSSATSMCQVGRRGLS